MAKIIKEQLIILTAQVTDHDITTYSDREKTLELTPYDAVIFGFPVYGDKTPRPIKEWLEKQDGMGKKCSMFFTYGGVSIDLVHGSTKLVLENQNFRVVSSAEFLGAHTFNLAGWTLLRNRPDNADFSVAREYAKVTYKRFLTDDFSFITRFNLPPYDESPKETSGKSTRSAQNCPTRNNQKCSMCLKCEELCSTGAMNAETGMADGELCILCLRCIAICPDNVIKINDLSHFWRVISERRGITEEIANKKESKIYL